MTFPMYKSPVASEVPYDNATSGLASTSVQDAITEIASGNATLPYNTATATTNTTTSSTAYVLMSGMTLTPAAGTYHVTFGSSALNNNNNAQVRAAIYSGGVVSDGSERIIYTEDSNQIAPFSITAIVTVNGSQAIEGRWRVTGGTATGNSRSLVIVRIAP